MKPRKQDNVPVAPGFYEYKWLHGSPAMRHDWHPVAVIQQDDELFVVDPGLMTLARLTTYTNTEWRTQVPCQYCNGTRRVDTECGEIICPGCKPGVGEETT